MTTVKGDDSVLSIGSRGSMRYGSVDNSIDRTDKHSCSCAGDRKERNHGNKPSVPRAPKQVLFAIKDQDSMFSANSKEKDKLQTLRKPPVPTINRSTKPRK